MEKEEKKRDWSETKFTKLIRITEENQQYLKQNKIGRYSMAGMLDFIINEFKKKNKK